MRVTAMRIDQQHAAGIREIVLEAAGADARVRLFGSRLHDERRGGDVDLLVELDREATDPAWLSARIEARVSRLMGGRRVDVVLSASNLSRLPIHEVAEREGVVL